jgi:hypothetical protein
MENKNATKPMNWNEAVDYICANVEGTSANLTSDGWEILCKDEEQADEVANMAEELMGGEKECHENFYDYHNPNNDPEMLGVWSVYAEN